MNRKILLDNASPVSLKQLAAIFTKTGATSFGGWSTMVVLLEKELEESGITTVDLKGATAYAQILPGATQVAIASNAGYQLRGFPGALVATISYITPVVILILIFSNVYFRYLVHADLLNHLSGLVAALSGVILANAYRIGSKHTSRLWLWSLVALACVAQFVFLIHGLLIIIVFGGTALLLSLAKGRRTKAAP